MDAIVQRPNESCVYKTYNPHLTYMSQQHKITYDMYSTCTAPGRHGTPANQYQDALVNLSQLVLVNAQWPIQIMALET